MSPNSTWWEAADRRLPRAVDPLRRELDMYFHAVRIFGTTLGGYSTDRPGAR
jgi:hypothetical protein